MSVEEKTNKAEDIQSPKSVFGETNYYVNKQMKHDQFRKRQANNPTRKPVR